MKKIANVTVDYLFSNLQTLDHYISRALLYLTSVSLGLTHLPLLCNFEPFFWTEIKITFILYVTCTMRAVTEVSYILLQIVFLNFKNNRNIQICYSIQKLIQITVIAKQDCSHKLAFRQNRINSNNQATKWKNNSNNNWTSFLVIKSNQQSS